jgi:hypothetical protein
MCQACWALASRRSGETAVRDEAQPRPRFSAVAEWADEPDEDEAEVASPTADAQDR